MKEGSASLLKTSEPKKVGNGIIGGSGSGSGNPGALGGQNEAVALSPCPCGNDAVWYQVGPPKPTSGRGKSIGHMTIDDENLCDACLSAMVPEDDRTRWKRLDTEHRANQDRGFGFDTFDDGPAQWD